MVSIGGKYQLDPELAGKTVILWWGLFDTELFVEAEGRRYGPFHPSGGPIPLHRYRKYKKSRAEKRADAIEALAREISLSKNALATDSRVAQALGRALPDDTNFIKFQNPDPFDEFTYPNTIDAKKAISEYLGIPLSRLNAEQLEMINAILSDTLKKLLGKIQNELLDEKEIRVSKSLSVEKHRVKVPTLIHALFYDLSTEKDVKIP
jgi:hypothetical protein